MEIGDSLESYIVSFDNVLLEKNLKYFLKYCKTEIYKTSEVVDGKGKPHVDKKVRNVTICSLICNTKSLTKVHWSNFFQNVFNLFMKDYIKMLNLDINIKIDDIQILKYKPGGHYVFHIDDCKTIPRTLSCIFLVNDNYEGGDLVFSNPLTRRKIKIEKKQNRLIIWPSNFLYPHCVEPVKSNERYSVVGWAS
jgi:hypothetical protein